MFVGLGWTCRTSLDLDCGALLCDGSMNLIDTVYFANKTHGTSVKHGGDNRTGVGSGDDERIMMDLDTLEAAVRNIFIVVNVYTSSGSVC